MQQSWFKISIRFLFVLALCGLCFAPSSALALNNWERFCIDIYVVALPDKSGRLTYGTREFYVTYDGRNYQRRQQPGVVKKSILNSKTVAKLDPKSANVDVKYLNKLIREMILNLNKSGKSCKVWFASANIRVVDGSKAKFAAKDQNGINKTYTLDQWFHAAGDAHYRAVDPNKRIDKMDFLAAFARWQKSFAPKTKCLSMVLVTYPQQSKLTEAGKAVVTGNHSVVSLDTLKDPLNGGNVAMHEVLHNLGLMHSHSTRVPSSNGKIDVMVPKVDRTPATQNVKLVPTITPKDCTKLCKDIITRKTKSWLVNSETKDPPKDYLNPPKVAPVKPKETAKTPKAQVCPPVNKTSAGKLALPGTANTPSRVVTPKPKRIAVRDLPMPTKTTEADALKKIIAQWRANTPKSPTNCCGARTVAGNIKYIRAMRERLDDFERKYYKFSKPYLSGAKSRTEGDYKRMRRANSTLRKLNRDLKKRLIEHLRKARALKRTKSGKIKCDHTAFLLTPPRAPRRPDGSEYAFAFARATPEQCVATTYYVGDLVGREVSAPGYLFDQPNAAALYPTDPIAQDGSIASCPGSRPSTQLQPPDTSLRPTEDTGPEFPDGSVEIIVAYESNEETVILPGPDDPFDLGANLPADEVAAVENTTVADIPNPEDPAPEELEVVEVRLDEPVVTAPEDGVDLGLVKASDTVVQIALTGVDGGDAIQSASIKLLEPAPELPGLASETSNELFALENYLEEVPDMTAEPEGFAVALAPGGSPAGGTTSDRPQLITITQDDAGSRKGNTLPEEDATRQEVQLASVSNLEVQQIFINKERTSHAIVTGNAPLTPGVRSGLDANLLPAGAKACVERSFRIGDRPVFVVRLPQANLPEFTRRVASSSDYTIEPDLCRKKEQATDPLYRSSGLWGQDFDNQWAVRRVGFDENALPDWPDEESLLEPVTVAVIDTGLDWYHPDLPAEALWDNDNEIADNGVDDDGNGYVDDVIGWNFIDSNNRPWDHDGHGTFVTGIIAAASNNDVGIAGINPAAEIMVLKALDAFGNGQASHVAEAITYAADNGAKVINLSLGGRGLTHIEKLAVDYARARGALLVVAAGNDGKEVKDYSPAGLEGVLTVSATDTRDRRAGFSNWGPRIDIAAPGVDVLSLRGRRTDLLSLIPGVSYKKGAGIVGKDRAYFRASGTSFAAPIVSGTASLILSRNPLRTADEVSRMMLQSARDIETPGNDNFTGYGLLDAAAALAADPEFFIDSQIDGVRAIKKNGKTYLRVSGSIGANDLDHAVIQLSAGKQPKTWQQVKRQLTKPVMKGTIIDLPAAFFTKSKQWTLRLITKHRNGNQREHRFNLSLG